MHPPKNCSTSSKCPSIAIRTALGAESIARHCDPQYLEQNPKVAHYLKNFQRNLKAKAPAQPVNRKDAAFDRRSQKIKLSCIPDQLSFTAKKLTVKAGGRVTLTLDNPDATAHNWVLLQPGSEEAVGSAANLMAQDPSGEKRHFIPESDQILAYTPLVQPEESVTIRFTAPEKPGRYPYVCTFPGHWIIMRGILIVE